MRETERGIYLTNSNVATVFLKNMPFVHNTRKTAFFKWGKNTHAERDFPENIRALNPWIRARRFISLSSTYMWRKGLGRGGPGPVYESPKLDQNKTCRNTEKRIVCIYGQILCGESFRSCRATWDHCSAFFRAKAIWTSRWKPLHFRRAGRWHFDPPSDGNPHGLE